MAKTKKAIKKVNCHFGSFLLSFIFFVLISLFMEHIINVSSMGAYPPPADAGGGTGLSAPIFFALASHRKKGFPLQSLARKRTGKSNKNACVLAACFFALQRIPKVKCGGTGLGMTDTKALLQSKKGRQQVLDALIRKGLRTDGSTVHGNDRKDGGVGQQVYEAKPVKPQGRV
jgi:hypothetical protein